MTAATTTPARRMKFAAILVVAIVLFPVTIAVLLAGMKGTR